MKSFLKYTAASCLGVFVALVLVILAGSLLVGGLIAGFSNSGPNITTEPNSVLKLTLEEPLPEHTNNTPFMWEDFDFQYPKVLGLSDIVNTIEYAADDPDIKGIYLDMKTTPIGYSTTKVLREAIDSFQNAGKFVVSNANQYSQRGYYLASGADRIFVNPNGSVDFRGLGAIIPYFKKTLDALGIDIRVYYAGEFKSATEPFRRTDMSEENRLQTREYLLDIERTMYKAISEDRSLSLDSVYRASDEFLLRFASDAVDYGFVDEAAYEDTVFEYLREKLGLESGEEVNFIKLKKYYQSFFQNLEFSAEQKIAVVYAEGEITGQSSEPGSIAEKKYLDLLDDIQEDEHIKAVVLRINSPGGSALVSDNIWRKLQLIKDQGTPIVVSMGDFAASGGYYIAAPADYIFAEPTTLTGSIGVYSTFPNVNGLLTNKMNLRFDSVQTAPFATKFNPIYPNTPQEDQIMETFVDSFYQQFLRRVAHGRDMSVDSVKEVASGRIWSGADAVKNNLVDSLGGLEQAIAYAARSSDLKDYRLDKFPKIKDPIEQLMSDFMGDEMKMNLKNMLWRESIPTEYKKQVEELKHIFKAEEPMARLPFILVNDQ